MNTNHYFITYNQTSNDESISKFQFIIYQLRAYPKIIFLYIIIQYEN
jgi:hypothetical protein